MRLHRLLLVSVIVLSSANTLLAAEKPNIIFVVADDLGWSDLGCYGSEIPTPNLDALAAGGLRFRQFYNNAVCGPTRASILTGLHCQRIGHHGQNWNQPTNFTQCVTLGEVLRPAGYRTLMVGKWQERDLPAKRGFDRFFGPMCQGKISYFDEVQLNPFYLDEQRWSFPKADFSMTDVLTDHAVRFVEEATTEPKLKAKPFFLYLAYVAPHWPLHASEAEIAPHRERYRAGWDAIREARLKRQRDSGLVPATWTTAPRPNDVHAWSDEKHAAWQVERMAVYAALVTSIDRGVGRVMDAVRKAGASDNTLVMFVSDNGAAPDGGLVPSNGGLGFTPGKPTNTWRLDGVPIRPGSGPTVMPGPGDTFAAYGRAWATVSNAPLRSTKMFAYEGGVRTPFIAHWPRVITKGGDFSDRVGHVVDVMATCLDVAGAQYPQEFQGRKPLPLDGRSLLPAFRNEVSDGHAELYWNAPQNRAIRSGSWKLVSNNANSPWELYDLTTDVAETRDRAKEHPDRVRELVTRWQQWAATMELTKRKP